MAEFWRNFCKRRGDSLEARGRKREALAWLRRAGEEERVAELLGQTGDAAGASEISVALVEAAASGGRRPSSATYRRASEEYVARGEIDKGARAALEAGDAAMAAQLYLDHGKGADAAALLERHGGKSRAAEIYLSLENYDKAIALFREVGDLKGLVESYKRKGDLAQAGEECAAAGDIALAAAFYEEAGQLAKAAELLEANRRSDQAMALFERLGDFDRVARMHAEAGHLDLAAQTYEKAHGRDLEAAQIYESLLVLEESSRRAFEKGPLCGAMAREADVAYLGDADHGFICATAALEQVWKMRVLRPGIPRFVAAADDGTRAALATEGPMGAAANTLLLISDQKQVIWETELAEPAKELGFWNGDAGWLACQSESVVCYGPDGAVRWEFAADFKPWTLDISPEGEMAVVGTLGGSVLLLKPDGKAAGQHSCGERVRMARFSADGERILAAVGDSTLKMFDRDLREVWGRDLGKAFRLAGHFPVRDTLYVVGDSDVSLLDAEGNPLIRRSLEARALAALPDFRNKLLWLFLENGSLVAQSAVDCRRQAAECYLRSGKLLEAARLFESIEEYEKAYGLFKQIGEYEQAAKIKHLTGDIRTAARHYEVINMYETAARLYSEIDESYLAAKNYARSGHSMEAAKLFESLNDPIMAADCYERAGETKRAGLLFLAVNQKERALENLTRSFEANPEDAEAAYQLGSLSQDLDRIDESIKYYQKLLDDESYRRQALQHLGQCFMRKQLFDVAIDRFQEALGDNPKPNRENIDLYYDLGRTYEAAERFAEAKSAYAKVLAIDYYYRDVQARLNKAEESSQMRAAAGSGAPAATIADDISLQKTGALTKEARYQIVRKLGEGGMGVVYLAHDMLLDRRVAWKVLPLRAAPEERMRERFLREARAAAQLSDPRIVSVYDIVMNDAEYSISMEYVEGGSLRTKLIEQPMLPLADVLGIGREIALGLFAAHQAGVVHRDVKPENVMIAKSGQVKLVDFGLARLQDDVQLTKEGCMIGTLAYMAPEQIRVEEFDLRTDIYALGVMLFEMLAGRTPFYGGNVIAQHLMEPPPRLREVCADAPEELDVLIHACLSKDKADRPPDCETIAKRLDALRG